MSNLKVNTINDASGGSNAVLYGVASPPNSMGFRNRIINGDMRIDQRNAGAAVTAEGYLVDRWRVWRDQTYSIQQSTDAPSGFATSLAVTKTNTTQSIYAYLTQYIEGFNFADMLFGTANAKTITLSFWVKSSVTGTFSAGLVNSAETRAYSATYTVSAANTWEQKTITIAGDASGTWIGSTNGKGCGVWFNFGSAGGGGTNTANAWVAGAVNPASGGTANLGTTNGATFYITGVQLEAGTVASPFERRDYGREFIMCQRYYYKIEPASAGQIFGSGFNQSTTIANVVVPFPVQMRTAPSTLEQTGTAGDYRVNCLATAVGCTSVPSFAATSKYVAYVVFTTGASLVAGQGIAGSCTSTSAFLAWGAEL